MCVPAAKETEADRFAHEILVPLDVWESFVLDARFSESGIRAFFSSAVYDYSEGRLPPVFAMRHDRWQHRQSTVH